MSQLIVSTLCGAAGAALYMLARSAYVRSRSAASLTEMLRSGKVEHSRDGTKFPGGFRPKGSVSFSEQLPGMRIEKLR
jgi:hypothetical protein